MTRVAGQLGWLYQDNPCRPHKISVVIDFIIKLLISKDLVTKVKYDNILVIIDRFTKYIKFELYKEVTGVEELV